MLASRVSRVSSSPTLAVLVESERLRRQGVDVVDFGAGEPDFPTPAHVKDAAHEAINRDFTRYTANAGIEELKQAICTRYRADYGVEYGSSEIIISAGGKQALYNTALALFGPGDEVITHAPCWPTLVEQIKLADATPVMVRTHAEDGFRLHPQRIADAVTPRTRGIVLNSPGNPTGALIAEDDLAAIVDIAVKHDLWIVLDLCYERLIYDKVPHNLPKVLVDRMRDRTVLCGSASKAYSMTGWRCGWTIGPAPVVKACNAFQSHVTSNACSISQKAVVAAFEGSQDCVGAMLDEYRSRRDKLSEWLGADSRFRFVPPAGAFYLFPDISLFLSPDGFRTSADFAKGLLDEVHVALTPGEAFDAPGFLRISYATSVERLQEGVRRIHSFVTRHCPAEGQVAAG